MMEFEKVPMLSKSYEVEKIEISIFYNVNYKFSVESMKLRTRRLLIMLESTYKGSCIINWFVS